MPAIVRVKRRIDEEPLNAFVLNGKKRRLNNETESIAAIADDKEEISTLLKFAGTINELDNTATTQFARRINKDDAQNLVQEKSARKAANITERARQEMRQQLHENRFRVVNCMRTEIDGEPEGDSTGPKDGVSDVKSLTIVDIEKQNNETETILPMQQDQANAPSDSDTGYVYDLYLPDDDVQARNVDLMDDNYLSVRAYPEIIFEDAYNDAQDEDYDSEDSNREDYFTNDYPDEDDDQELHSANEYDEDEEEDVRHMRHAVENFVFGDDDEDENSEQDIYGDVSSDDDADYYAYEDPYVQSIDMDNDNFVPDIDTHDVQSITTSYDHYHKRLMKRLGKSDSDDEADDDDDFKETQDSNKGSLNISNDVEFYHSADEQE